MQTILGCGYSLLIMRGKRTAVKDETPLLKALQLAAHIQAAKGEPEHTHCHLSNGMLTATNGILSIGYPIYEELTVCPHTHSLYKIRKEFDGMTQFSEIAQDRISIKVDLVDGEVPCLPENQVPRVFPDAPVLLTGLPLLRSLATAGTLAAEKGQTVLSASVCWNEGSIFAADSTIAIECWHGYSIGNKALVIPKSAVTALSKFNSALHSVGITDDSITFRYDDNSWLKTQLYNQKIPLHRIKELFTNHKSFPTKFEGNLFSVAKRMSTFSEDGLLIFKDGECIARANDVFDTKLEKVTGIPDNELILSSKDLEKIAPLVTHWHWNIDKTYSMFFGDKLRGCIAHR
jgi:hypothetical protein